MWPLLAKPFQLAKRLLTYKYFKHQGKRATRSFNPLVFYFHYLCLPLWVAGYAYGSTNLQRSLRHAIFQPHHVQCSVTEEDRKNGHWNVADSICASVDFKMGWIENCILITMMLKTFAEAANWRWGEMSKRFGACSWGVTSVLGTPSVPFSSISWIPQGWQLSVPYPFVVMFPSGPHDAPETKEPTI